LPYAWVSIANPTDEAAVVSVTPKNSSAALATYDAETLPTPENLPTCINTSRDNHSLTEHNALVINPRSSLHLLVALYGGGTGAVDLDVKTDSLSPGRAGDQKLTIAPVAGQKVSQRLFVGQQSVGDTPDHAFEFECGSSMFRHGRLPYAWVALENPTDQAAVVSLAPKDAGSFAFAVYGDDTPAIPPPDKLPSCVTFVREKAVDGQRAVVINPHSSVRLLASIIHGGTGALDLEATTESLTPGRIDAQSVSIPAPGVTTTKRVLIGQQSVGETPDFGYHFECRLNLYAHRPLPYAWLKVENTTADGALVTVKPKNASDVKLVVYATDTLPSPENLASCTNFASNGELSGNNALALPPGTSLRVLVGLYGGGTGAVDLDVTTQP